MAQASNVIPLPGSPRPTVPPEDTAPISVHPLEGDNVAKLVSSAYTGLNHAITQGGGTGRPTNWLAGFIVAVGMFILAACGWVGVQIGEIRDDIADMRKEHAAQVQAQSARDTAQNSAIFALHDSQRAFNKWTQRIMLDMWMKQNPDREPPQPPDTDSDDRVFLNLR